MSDSFNNYHRLDQLAQHLDTPADSSGNEPRLKQLAPIYQGHWGGGGFRGSDIQKSGITTKFGTRLRIHLGMDIG